MEAACQIRATRQWGTSFKKIVRTQPTIVWFPLPLLAVLLLGCGLSCSGSGTTNSGGEAGRTVIKLIQGAKNSDFEALFSCSESLQEEFQQRAAAVPDSLRKNIKDSIVAAFSSSMTSARDTTYDDYFSFRVWIPLVYRLDPNVEVIETKRQLGNEVYDTFVRLTYKSPSDAPYYEGKFIKSAGLRFKLSSHDGRTFRVRSAELVPEMVEPWPNVPLRIAGCMVTSYMSGYFHQVSGAVCLVTGDRSQIEEAYLEVNGNKYALKSQPGVWLKAEAGMIFSGANSIPFKIVVRSGGATADEISAIYTERVPRNASYIRLPDTVDTHKAFLQFMLRAVSGAWRHEYTFDTLELISVNNITILPNFKF